MIEHQWGAIAKREREHLVASDREIIGIRRRLLKLAKNLANGIEPEEPFLLKGIRQEFPDTLVVPQSNRLDGGSVDQIISALNTNRLSKEGVEDEVMWTPSVEADDSGMTTPVK
jgi:hypothetical protein